MKQTLYREVNRERGQRKRRKTKGSTVGSGGDNERGVEYDKQKGMNEYTLTQVQRSFLEASRYEIMVRGQNYVVNNSEFFLERIVDLISAAFYRDNKA